MKKAIKLLALATLWVAMVTSCSSGSLGGSVGSVEEGYGACYGPFIEGVDAKICITSEDRDKPMTREICNLAEADADFRERCPSGHILRCEKNGLLTYYYGAYIKSMGWTCNDL